ncbi:hypothetical protein [Streptomyces noursei]|uniref:hypothetical protein n=1 Tax=Streptomyces noursei TaxID=1971 RepID=UPI00167607B2|nr:hypothetical protein [Streptomyces noursei]MCZ1021269.1 hypothetical protein [Streptomyces noursei]GGX54861.1 hypothetical protein GCM10010341_89870 [Streptomyces noursei]
MTAIVSRPLTSAVLTQPVPLTVGREATLDIVIANSSGQQSVQCNQIIVVIPAGNLPQDLLPTGQKTRASTESTAGAWSFTRIKEDALNRVPDGERPTFSGTTKYGYQATPHKDAVHTFAKVKLHLVLEIPRVNDEVGTATIEVRSHVRNSDDDDWRWEYSFHQLGKYPARANLTPVANLHIVEGEADSKKIVTQISRDKKFTLKWDGPDIAYTLYSPIFDGGCIQVAKNKKNDLCHTIEAGVITRDTTFVLQSTSQSGLHEQGSYLAITLTATEPTFPSMEITENIRAANVTATRMLKSSKFEVRSQHDSVNIQGGKLVATKLLFSEGDIGAQGRVFIKGQHHATGERFTPRAIPGSSLPVPGSGKGNLLWVPSSIPPQVAKLGGITAGGTDTSIARYLFGEASDSAYISATWNFDEASRRAENGTYIYAIKPQPLEDVIDLWEDYRDILILTQVPSHAIVGTHFVAI